MNCELQTFFCRFIKLIPSVTVPLSTSNLNFCKSIGLPQLNLWAMASKLAIKETAAGFVIFRKEANKFQYLLLQTSYGIRHWTPPKGHVDPGETELETAFRETEEETGLVKADFKVYEDSRKTLEYEVNGAPKIVHYWLAELTNPRATVRLSEEHQDFKWLDLESAYPYARFEDMKDLLRYCDKYLKEICPCK